MRDVKRDLYIANVNDTQYLSEEKLLFMNRTSAFRIVQQLLDQLMAKDAQLDEEANKLGVYTPDGTVLGANNPFSKGGNQPSDAPDFLKRGD